MKKLIIPALFLTLSFSAIANVELPRITAPVELVSGEFAEGTLTRLTDAEVAEFLPWAQNAQNQLNRAMKQAQSMPLRERLGHIERAVRSVVSRSEGRQYQMFMRYALNRGLLLVDELEKNSNMDEIGAQESALDILQRSIKIGLSFYESDLNFQRRAQSGNTTTVLENARFAAAFMQGMYPGVINVLDATAQYRLLYKLIEMVNWDLSRDADAAKYAETIVEAHEMTVDLPELALNNDKDNLRLIRRLNSLRIIQVRNISTSTRVTEEQIETVQEILNPPTPSGDWVRCETSSNSRNFSNNSRSRDLSYRTALNECQSNSGTNNTDCAVNITCNDGRTYRDFVRCETSSNGRNFSHNTRDRDHSYKTAVNTCQANSGTNNTDCASNVSCNDGRHYSEFVRCETSSNGRNFSYNTRNRNHSYQTAVNACQANSGTNNTDCSANVSCNDGRDYPEFVRCETSSNGRNFSHSSRSRNHSYQTAVNACQANSGTNNAECAANIYCP